MKTASFAQDTVAEDDLVLHPAEDVVSRVVHRVGAVAETEDIDVVLVAADQRVVAEAAVEKVLVGKAVDGVVALRRARRNECLDDFFPREIGAIGEGKDLDPIEPLLAKGTGVGRSELIGDGQAVVLVSRNGNHKVQRWAIAGEHQVLGRNALAENHHVAGFDQDVFQSVLDRVVVIADIEEIAIAVLPTLQGIVAGPAIQVVDRARADHRVRCRLRVAHRFGDVVQVPDGAVGKNYLADACVIGEVAAEQARKPPSNWRSTRMVSPVAVDRQDQVDAVTGGRDVGRRQMGETDDVGHMSGHQRALDIVDDIVSDGLPNR